MKKVDWKDIGDNLLSFILMIGFFGALIGGGYWLGHRTPSEPVSAATCRDVTSIDHNWENDVLCTRPDGSEFYTDYAGGHENDPNFSRN